MTAQANRQPSAVPATNEARSTPEQEASWRQGYHWGWIAATRAVTAMLQEGVSPADVRAALMEHGGRLGYWAYADPVPAQQAPVIYWKGDK